LPPPDGRPRIFLAGSIDGGQAPDWQAAVSAALADCDVTILNPRRAIWHAKAQSDAADPVFRHQVEWELAGLEQADTIAMYLAPSSLAPISLLELGLHAGSNKLILCCEDGFWRKGNVEIVAQRWNIDCVRDLAALKQTLRARYG
jgi:hypothetical protein